MPTLKFFAIRCAQIFTALVIALYITVWVANYGGYLDQMILANIEQQVAFSVASNPHLANAPQEVKEKYIRTQVELLKKAYGLDRPFFPDRSFIYLWKLMRLDLGNAYFLYAASGSHKVIDIIMERLPATVLLITLGTILSAIIGVLIGAYLSRKPLTRFDRAFIPFALVTYVLPAWFLGILFILIFSYYLRIFPSGGMFSPNPPENPLLYTLDFLYHLALPLSTWVFAYFGIWAYTTRNLLIQTAHEDFVVTAKAKGLPERLIQRRYVIRVALPPIITGVSLAVVASITGAIITEYVFNWPGVGQLYITAVEVGDAPIVIGVTAIYAYLLVATVLILSILYGLLDPRIRE